MVPYESVEIVGYDIILRHDWLVRANPDINWAEDTWRWRPSTGRRGDKITTAACYREILAGATMLVVYPYPSAQLGSPPLLAAAYGEGDGHPALRATASGARDAIPQSYYDYKDVFDASQSARLPENSAHDHPIDLKPDSQPPHRPIYPLSGKELETLREYIDNATQKG